MLDGSLGATGDLQGPNYHINATHGKQVGSNLFHSFTRFNISNIESATFSGDASIRNVISRVTGGDLSSIDGELKVAIPNSNFFFINPAGVILGPDSKISVDGSFNVSTAAYLTLPNGGRFDARNVGQSLLTTGDPVAYGFLDANIGSITIESNGLQTNGHDVVIIGSEVMLDGGDPTYLRCGPLDCTDYDPHVETQGGDVYIASITDEGAIAMGDQGFDFSGAEMGGEITMKNQFSIDTSGQGAGGVFIRGGKFVMKNSNIVAVTNGSKDGMPIDIQARNVTFELAHVESATTSSGAGSEINIRAEEQVHMLSGSALWVWSEERGDTGRTPGVTVAADGIVMGGSGTRAPYLTHITSISGSQEVSPIRLSARDIQLNVGATIQSVLEPASKGADIIVDGGMLSLADGGIVNPITIATDGVWGSFGKINPNAGKTLVTSDIVSVGKLTRISSANNVALDALSITLGGGIIRSNDGVDIDTQHLRLNDGVVSGRIIDISASDIQLEGQLAGIFSEPSQSTSQDSPPGSIQIEANTLDIRKGARISTTTRGDAAGSSLSITAHESIHVMGTAPYTDLDFDKTPKFLAGFRSGIFSESTGRGRGGNITIRTADMTIADSGTISANSEGLGNGGSIDVAVQNILAIRGKGASIETTSSGEGDAGNVVLTASNILLSNQALINTESRSGGDAGNIAMEAEQAIELAQLSHIRSNAGGSGASGDISLLANSIQLAQSSIESESRGDGLGGAIRLKAQELFSIENGSLVSNSTFGDGDAQPIHLTARNLYLSDHSQIQSLSGKNGVRDGSGHGGDIQIRAENLFISGVNDGQMGFPEPSSIKQDSRFEDYLQMFVPPYLLATYLEDQSQLTPPQRNEIRNHYLNFQDHLYLIDRYTARDGVFSGILASSVSHGDAGNIAIDAGQFTLMDAAIDGSSSGLGRAGHIQINSLSTNLSGGRILVESSGDALAGAISLHAGEAMQLDRSMISSRNFTSSDGGSITLTSDKNILITDESVVTSSTTSNGDAGDIYLDAPLIEIRGGSRISSTTGLGAEQGSANLAPVVPTVLPTPYVPTHGDGGDITLVGERVVLSDEVYWEPTSFINYLEEQGLATFLESYIRVFNEPGYYETLSSEERLAFNETLSALKNPWYIATHSVRSRIIYESTRDPGGIFSTSYSEGNAGDIRVDANSIEITGKTQLSTATAKPRPSYDDDLNEVVIPKNGSNGGDIDLIADRIAISSHGLISLPVSALIFGYIRDVDVSVVQAGLYAFAASTTGVAGDITLVAKDVLVAKGANISSSSSSSGGGGGIRLIGDRIAIDGADDPNNAEAALTRINAGSAGDVEEGVAGGHAGAIELMGSNIRVTAGAVISSSTIGNAGRGGVISVHASDTLQVSGRHKRKYDTVPTAILAITKGSGEGGSIDLHGNRVMVLDHAIIDAQTMAEGSGGSITVSGNQAFIRNGAAVSAASHSEGAGGTIAINANEVDIKTGASVSTASHGVGDAGVLRINASESLNVEGSNTAIRASAESSGNGGRLSLVAGQIRISDGAIATTTTQSTGKGGEIELNASNNVILSGASTSLLAETFGPGDGGSIAIRGKQTQVSDRAIVSTASHGDGAAGTVTIDSNKVDITGGASVSTASQGTGDAGVLRIDASETLNVEGSNTTIRASAESSGNGGRLSLTAKHFRLLDGAKVTTTTHGIGKGGEIELNANGNIVLYGIDTGLLAEAFGRGGSGSVTINGKQAHIGDGATVSTASHGDGSGGTVRIGANVVTVSGARVTSQSSGTGNGGNIRIVGRDLLLEDGAVIRASNTGSGDAGSIDLVTSDTIRMTDSEVSSESARGGGGELTILTNKLLDLNRSKISTSVLSGNGTAGNIFIDPELVRLQGSAIQANAVHGDGGNIQIRAGVLLQDVDSLIEASSQFGIDGAVILDTPLLPLRDDRKPPKGAVKRLLRSRCKAKQAGSSSFTINLSTTSTHRPDAALVATRSDISDQNQPYAVDDLLQVAAQSCIE